MSRSTGKKDRNRTRPVADLVRVFEELRAILQMYEGPLAVVADSPDRYALETADGKGLPFGEVKRNRNHVSYHLEALSLRPQLLAEISTELGARFHARASFHFRAVESEIFRELAVLTKLGYLAYGEQGLVRLPRPGGNKPWLSAAGAGRASGSRRPG